MNKDVWLHSRSSNTQKMEVTAVGPRDLKFGEFFLILPNHFKHVDGVWTYFGVELGKALNVYVGPYAPMLNAPGFVIVELEDDNAMTLTMNEQGKLHWYFQ